VSIDCVMRGVDELCLASVSASGDYIAQSGHRRESVHRFVGKLYITPRQEESSCMRHRQLRTSDELLVSISSRGCSIYVLYMTLFLFKENRGGTL
jgi:hypothetical protein